VKRRMPLTNEQRKKLKDAIDTAVRERLDSKSARIPGRYMTRKTEGSTKGS
jgi:hypothetical protein